MVGDSSALPLELRERAEAARRALGPGDIEWAASAAPELGAMTSTVLSVASLPSTQREVLALFRDWRERLGIDATIHLIEPDRQQRANALVSALRRRSRGSTVTDRDVVEAIRAVGWTVTAIDRIDVDQNGSSQRWVDLHATDVVGKATQEQS